MQRCTHCPPAWLCEAAFEGGSMLRGMLATCVPPFFRKLGPVEPPGSICEPKRGAFEVRWLLSLQAVNQKEGQ